MKRALFISISLLCLLIISGRLYAQTATVNGKMQLATKESKMVNVDLRYQQTSDIMQFLLIPEQPISLQVRIVNKEGVAVRTLPPQEVQLRYVSDVDLAGLPKGEYFLEVAAVGGPAPHRVAFQK